SDGGAFCDLRFAGEEILPLGFHCGNGGLYAGWFVAVTREGLSRPGFSRLRSLSTLQRRIGEQEAERTEAWSGNVNTDQILMVVRSQDRRRPRSQFTL